MLEHFQKFHEFLLSHTTPEAEISYAMEKAGAKNPYGHWEQAKLGDLKEIFNKGMTHLTPPGRFLVLEIENKEEREAEKEYIKRLAEWLSSGGYAYASVFSGGASTHFWIPLSREANNGEREALVGYVANTLDIPTEFIDRSSFKAKHLWPAAGAFRSLKDKHASLQEVKEGNALNVPKIEKRKDIPRDGLAEQIKQKITLFDIEPSLKPGLQSCLLPGHRHGDRNPSLSVELDGKLFNCFSSHGGGDIFTWVMARDNVQFPMALAFLAEKAGVKAHSEKKTSGKLKINLMTARELGGIEFEPLEYVMTPHIPVGSLAVLGGKSGSGKTFFAAALALAVARGEPFLGQFPTAERVVLYLDSENGKREMQKRLRLLSGEQTELPENFIYAPYPVMDLGTKETLEWFQSFLAEHKGALIVIDVFARIFTREENDAGQMGPMLLALKKLAAENDCTILMIHHVRKTQRGRSSDGIAEDLRGTSEIRNLSDVILGIEKRGSFFFVKHVKSRTGPEQDAFRVNIDPEGQFLQYGGSFEETEHQVEACAKQIRKWLYEENKQDFKTGEAREAMAKFKFNGKAVSRGIAWLVDKGQVLKVSRGNYSLVIDEEDTEGTKGQKGQIRLGDKNE